MLLALPVLVTNVDGSLKTTWIPVGNYTWPGGLAGAARRPDQAQSYQQTVNSSRPRSVMSFSFLGTGNSDYQGVGVVSMLNKPPGKTRRYIGRLLGEACGEPTIRLGSALISKNNYGEAPLSNVIIPGNDDEFRWICGTSNEESGYLEKN